MTLVGDRTVLTDLSWAFFNPHAFCFDDTLKGRRRPDQPRLTTQGGWLLWTCNTIKLVFHLFPCVCHLHPCSILLRHSFLWWSNGSVYICKVHHNNDLITTKWTNNVYNNFLIEDYVSKKKFIDNHYPSFLTWVSKRTYCGHNVLPQSATSAIALPPNW